MAASAFVNNLFTLFTFLLMGYSYGLTPIVSALFGQGKQAEAGEQLKPALLSGTAFCLLLMAVWGIAFFNLEHFGQPDELLPLIRPYFLVILVSMIFVMLYNELRQFTDGLTHTTLGMYTLIIGNAFNILGNWLLIYGPGPFPEMGLLGAGIATLLARVLMVVLMVAALWWKKGYAPYHEGFARCRASLDGMRAIVRASLPIAIQMGLECAAFTMSAVMAGWVGKVELAAYQVMVTIGTLGFLLYYSFGAGTSIRVANFYGQHDRTNVFHAGAAGRNLLFLMAACSSLLIYLLAEPLIRVFTTDTAVIAISLSLIPFLVLYQFADAMQICYANILRGTGHVLAMVRIAIISYLIVNIPAAFILGFSLGWGVKGIFLAFFIGLFTAATLFFKEYRKAMR